MHFSVLLPLDGIEGSTFENSAREAQETAANITPAEGLEGIGAKINKEYLASMTSGFAVAVDNAVNCIMEPYAQDAEVEFYDETDDLKHQYETGTMSVFIRGTKMYKQYDDEMKKFKVCDDGVVREKVDPSDWQSKVFLSPAAKEIRFESVPIKKFYKTFKKYADENASYDEEQDAYGYWSNPNCFYDWYSIGGRWQGEFLVKVGKECYDGVSGLGGPCENPAPEGYVWTSAARYKDIEWEKMAELKDKKNHEDFNKLATAMGEYLYGSEEEAHKMLPGYVFKEDGIYSWREKIFDPNESEEEFVAKRTVAPEALLATIFYGVLDTQCDPCDYPYYEHEGSTVDEWTDKLMDIISDYSDDVVLCTVDCHM